MNEEEDQRVKHLNELHKVDAETMKIMGTQNRKQHGFTADIDKARRER